MNHRAKKDYGCVSHRCHRTTVMPENRRPLSPRTVLALIIGGLILWGVYVAAGVRWYGLNPAGAVVVLVCMAMFLGFWLLLLRTQARNKQD